MADSYDNPAQQTPTPNPDMKSLDRLVAPGGYSTLAGAALLKAQLHMSGWRVASSSHNASILSRASSLSGASR